MNIEIKKSKKPIKYENAIQIMEQRLIDIHEKKVNELIWILEHNEIYTAGTSYTEEEVLDKSIKILKTNRGGKITYHGPGQLICYFVIDLKKRNKDIRKLISLIEKTIIDTLKFYNIKTFADKDNIGIWYNDRDNVKKVAVFFSLNQPGGRLNLIAAMPVCQFVCPFARDRRLHPNGKSFSSSS